MRTARWVAGVVTVGCAALAWAQDVTVSATVDKTTVEVANPIQLTITISGDLNGLKMAPFNLSPDFAVASRSQATNFSIRGGVQERSMSLLFILVPAQAGTFKLGPFKFSQGKQEFQTQPIEITVKKSALPPNLPSSGERFTL